MFMLNDKPLAIDTPFTHNDVQYPANWLRLTTLAEKEAIGITEVADHTPYDDRFYWGPGNPKQLEDETVTPEEGDSYVQKGLKSLWVSNFKQTAGTLLATTDWMVIRKAERDVAIPDVTVTYRAAVLTECDRLCAAVVACSNVEELVEVLANQSWPRGE